MSSENKKGAFIGTYNGTQFWVTDPREEDVNIESIVHALSYNVRFNGNTSEPWSVAQHSLLVAFIAENELIRAGVDACKRDLRLVKYISLLHDASEGYMSDIARPFKNILTQYKDLEQAVSDVVYRRMGVEQSDIDRLYTYVKTADNIALAIEAIELMEPCAEWKKFGGFDGDDVEIYLGIRSIYTENPQYVKGALMESLIQLSLELGIALTWLNDPLYANQKEILAVMTLGYTPIITKGVLEYAVSYKVSVANIVEMSTRAEKEVSAALLRNSMSIAEVFHSN